MLAYKGFHSDLTCTMGKGTFQYKQGVKYTEESAHCGRDGFHATDEAQMDVPCTQGDKEWCRQHAVWKGDKQLN